MKRFILEEVAAQQLRRFCEELHLSSEGQKGDKNNHGNKILYLTWPSLDHLCLETMKSFFSEFSSTLYTFYLSLHNKYGQQFEKC